MLPEIAPWPAFAAGLFLVFGGLAALSQSMPRHHAQVWSGPSSERDRIFWRLCAVALLFVALAACVLGWGIGAGLAAWLGLVTAAGLGLVFLLPYAARILRILIFAAPILGLAIFAVALVRA